MKWPWPSFQKALGEVLPGDLIVIAGRTGSGKTTFGMNLAWALARGTDPQRVGYIALECGEDLPVWFCLMHSGVSRFAQRDPDQMDAVAAAAMLPDWPAEYLHVENLPFPTPSVLEAKVEQLAAECDVLLIDHLAATDMERERMQERQVLGRMVRRLKVVASTAGVPVVVLHQMGRGERQRADFYRPPKIEDLFGSSSIEHTASIVLGIYRSLDPDGLNQLREYNQGAAIPMWKHELGMGVAVLKARHGARRYDLHLVTDRTESGQRTDRLLDDNPERDDINRRDLA